MGRVIRRSFFEEVSDRLPLSTTTLVVIVVGAVTLYIFCKRKSEARRPSPSVRRSLGAPKNEAEPADAMPRIKHRNFVGKRICIAWDVLHDGNGWKADGKALEVLRFYAFSSEVFLMCHINGEADKKKILSLVNKIEGIERHRVLFCTTPKGYEAFTRQLNPSLLITHDAHQVEFLKRIIQTLVLVGSEGLAGNNIVCVPSIAALEVDME